MEQKKIGVFEIEYDKMATKKATERLQTTEEGCVCDNCKNYSRAIDRVPEEVIEFLEELGLDYQKAIEVHEYGIKRGLVSYGGWYHIVGTCLSGTGNNRNVFQITKDYAVWFKNEADLYVDGFPRPILQMEIMFNIPWVIEEPYRGWFLNKNEEWEHNFKANKEALLHELDKIIDISLIDAASDYWIIDSVNDLSIEFFGDATIVYFDKEHKHFDKEHGCEGDSFIIETRLFIQALLSGQARLDIFYRGDKEIDRIYYIKTNNYEEVFKTFTLSRLLKSKETKTVSSIVEFKQQ